MKNESERQNLDNRFKAINGDKINLARFLRNKNKQTTQILAQLFITYTRLKIAQVVTVLLVVQCLNNTVIMA